MKALLLVALSGCVLDFVSAGRHPSVGELGLNTRRFTPEPAAPVAFRTNDPPPAAPPSGTATTATLRFTQSSDGPLFVGGEAEVGHLQTSRSNVAGGYAVLGARTVFGAGSVGVELAGGWRSVRTDVDAPDYSRLVAEPRARAELWLARQLSIGAAIGASLGEQVWMAGLYLGVHSSR